MFIKDPDAILDYGFDWSDWLGIDTISKSSWFIAPASLTKKSDSFTATTTTIWLNGGTIGTVYTVTNRIETAGKRTEDRSFDLVVGQR